MNNLKLDRCDGFKIVFVAWFTGGGFEALCFLARNIAWRPLKIAYTRQPIPNSSISRAGFEHELIAISFARIPKRVLMEVSVFISTN